jgi:hypothetical protein
MRDEGDEIWREIAGTNGAYEVSSLGRVRSMPRTVTRTCAGKSHTVTNRGKILTPTPNQGYPRVTMRVNGKTVYRMCHRLVAETFIGPCPPGQRVRHLDGNRANPALNNLAYGTRADNIADCKRHGTFRNGRSHLTKVMVHQIHFRRDDPATMLADAFGVPQHTIYAIRNGHHWRHVTGLHPRDHRRQSGHKVAA